MSTCTRPRNTKNTICIFFEFFGFLTPPGGISTTPDPIKEVLSSLANRKVAPFTSRVSIADGAYAISIHGQPVFLKQGQSILTQNFLLIYCTVKLWVPFPNIPMEDTGFIFPGISIVHIFVLRLVIPILLSFCLLCFL